MIVCLCIPGRLSSLRPATPMLAHHVVQKPEVAPIREWKNGRICTLIYEPSIISFAITIQFLPPD